jgi:hypothetical protein
VGGDHSHSLGHSVNKKPVARVAWAEESLNLRPPKQ